MDQITSTINRIADEWEYFQTKAINNFSKTQSTIYDMQHQLKSYSQKINQIENYINNPDSKILDSKMPDSKIIEEKGNNMEKYLRVGDISGFETKSLTSGTDSTQGFLVNPSFSHRIVNNIIASTPMRRLASIEKISSNALDVIIEDNNFTFGWVTETDERPVTETPKLIKKRILVHELYAQPKASQILLDDAEINIENWLSERLSEIFATAENNAFILGNGNAKPKGILSYKPEEVEQIATTSKGKLIIDDLMKLMNSLPDFYHKNATFLMNRKTLSEIQKLQDKSGRFIWQPAISESIPETLFGFPIVTCADMPVLAEDNLPIALADFKAAYKIVDRSGISLVRDPYTDKPFVKFYAVKRVGGEIINNQAIRILKS